MGGFEMRGMVSNVPGTCGVGVLHSFNLNEYNVNEFPHFFGGIGYNIAGFLDTSRCEETYNEIKRKYKIIFQSPVKRNRNSGNKFFFIIYTPK